MSFCIIQKKKEVRETWKNSEKLPLGWGISGEKISFGEIVNYMLKKKGSLGENFVSYSVKKKGVTLGEQMQTL